MISTTAPDHGAAPPAAAEREDPRLAPLYEAVVRRLAAGQHVPAATYRVQFNRHFTFRDAQEQVAYWHALGIGDLYASPYFAANPESLHGYDVVDQNRLNPEIGAPADYAALCAALREHGMGQLLDIVPNHMGIGGPANRWWMDVLENGPASVYAPYFDVEWDPINVKLTNKVLLPVLGDQYGRVLERGELQVAFAPDEGVFRLHYHEHVFPLEPRSYATILAWERERLLAVLGRETPAALEYQSMLTALQHLAPPDEADPDRRAERSREKEVVKRRLAALVAAAPPVGVHLAQALAALNGTPGDPRSFDRLDSLLDSQPYRLSFWRIAGEEINYRRFFDVNELAAVRVELPAVFEETHRTILALVASGAVQGLRIDHVDGLRDPAGYLRDLQRGTVRAVCRACFDTLPDAPDEATRSTLEAAVLARCEAAGLLDPGGRAGRPLYTVVEKILAPDEPLRPDWATCGTTGYEFANAVAGLLVDRANEKAFDALYADFTGETVRFADLANASKQQIMRLSLASEVNLLTNMLNHVSQADRGSRDFTLNSLGHAIREVIACFPVYRTYIRPGEAAPDAPDRAVIATAVARARRRNPATDPTIFDFLAGVLLAPDQAELPPAVQAARGAFVLKFQQVTGPVVAKGLEDTAFYVYNRLIALNEVGGAPDRFGLDVAAFHRAQAARAAHWPGSLLTTSTHDTKRGEDVRARIAVLSERPHEWRAALGRWARWNGPHKRILNGEPAPSPNEEYFLYQTLLGVWPAGPTLDAAGDADLLARLDAYMRKALNEAKVHSSWINTDEDYLGAATAFIRAILRHAPDNRFLADFRAFAADIAHYGAFNSLAQVLLKLTSPGVPDLYQGTELWDLSLVDPDNRRPVDYALRRRLLAEVQGIAGPEAAAALVAAWPDGRIKLFVTHRALTYRRAHRALYQDGAYTPLAAQGAQAARVVAFARRLDDAEALTVVPVRTAGLASAGARLTPAGGVWAGTTLAWPGAAIGARYRNIFTGEVLAVRAYGDTPGLALEDVLRVFPVALLRRE